MERGKSSEKNENAIDPAGKNFLTEKEIKKILEHEKCSGENRREIVRVDRPGIFYVEADESSVPQNLVILIQNLLHSTFVPQSKDQVYRSR